MLAQELLAFLSRYLMRTDQVGMFVSSGHMKVPQGVVKSNLGSNQHEI